MVTHEDMIKLIDAVWVQTNDHPNDRTRKMPQHLKDLRDFHKEMVDKEQD